MDVTDTLERKIAQIEKKRKKREKNELKQFKGSDLH